MSSLWTHPALHPTRPLCQKHRPAMSGYLSWQRVSQPGERVLGD